MKLVITREKLYATLILLPYIEGNFIQNIFDVYINNNAAIKAIVFFLIVAIYFFSVIVFSKTVLAKNSLENRYYNVMLFSFTIISFLFVLLLASDLIVSFCVWLWLCVPILFACSAVAFCRLLNLNITNIFLYMVRYFTVYIIIALFYYVLFRGLFVDTTVRFAPRGGGAVIFGYTMALIFALTLHVKDSFKKFEYYLILTVLTIGVFGTLSRGAVWMVLFCWFANFVLGNLNRKKVVFFTSLMVVLFLFANIDFEAIFSSTSFIGVDRLLNLNSFRRVETVLNILEFVKSLPLFERLFGLGLGNFFPYMYWWINIHDVLTNEFSYNGFMFLVQPHNSFLYLILETGFLGFIIILSVIVVSIQKLYVNRENCFIFQMLFFGVFIVSNLLDSVFFVQPGTSSSFWLLALLVVERHFQVTGREISCG